MRTSRPIMSTMIGKFINLTEKQECNMNEKLPTKVVDQTNSTNIEAIVICPPWPVEEVEEAEPRLTTYIRDLKFLFNNKRSDSNQIL